MTTPDDSYLAGQSIALTQRNLALVWASSGPEAVLEVLDKLSTQDLKHLVMMNIGAQALRITGE